MANKAGLLQNKNIQDYNINYLKQIKANATKWNEIDAMLQQRVEQRIKDETPIPLPDDLNITYFTTLGHYFEYCLYCAYDSLVRQINSNNYSVEEIKALLNSDVYNQGKNFDFSGGSDLNSQAKSAAETIKVWCQGGEEVSSELQEATRIAVGKIQKYSTLAARKIMAKNLSPLLALDGKNINLTNNLSLIADTGGKGNPLGDLKLDLIQGGDGFSVLELKWQNAAEKNQTDITWFSNTAEDTVFGGNNLSTYIQNHKKKLWRVTDDPQLWLENIITKKGLLNFMEGFGDGGSQLWYLLKKGQVWDLQKNADKGNKIIVHLDSTGDGQHAILTMKNLQKEDIQKLQDQTKGKGKSKKKGIQVKPSAHGLFYRAVSNERLATLEIEGFSKRESSAHEPKDYSFAFGMYITQRLLHNLSEFK